MHRITRNLFILTLKQEKVSHVKCLPFFKWKWKQILSFDIHNTYLLELPRKTNVHWSLPKRAFMRCWYGAISTILIYPSSAAFRTPKISWRPFWETSDRMTLARDLATLSLHSTSADFRGSICFDFPIECFDFPILPNSFYSS